MNEQENQAFKILHFYNSEDYGIEELKKYIKIIVNLVEKQQKEIEDYKECERLSKRQVRKLKNDEDAIKQVEEKRKNGNYYYCKLYKTIYKEKIIKKWEK